MIKSSALKDIMTKHSPKQQQAINRDREKDIQHAIELRKQKDHKTDFYWKLVQVRHFLTLTWGMETIDFNRLEIF